MENNTIKIGFSFDINNKEAPDGKHQFLIRLAKKMIELGIKIDNKKPDIYILLPREKNNNKARINVLRVDGLIMNTRWNYKGKNKKIVNSISNANAVIYQGKFCEMAYRKFLNINKLPFAIIPNGADPNEFLPRNVKNYFLANSKWRLHKRLKETINCFLLALDMGLDSDLIVTGKPDYEIKHPRIKYVGWQNRKQLKKLLSEAIASLHLTWLDWCPNSLVEAIVAQCPVIYTKSGGHYEIAKNSGISIKDTYWDWGPIDLYDPPPLDKKEVASAMIKIKNEENKYNSNELLNIDNVSKEYINFFKKILK